MTGTNEKCRNADPPLEGEEGLADLFPLPPLHGRTKYDMITSNPEKAKKVQLTSSARILVLELRDILDYALVLLEPPPPAPEAFSSPGGGMGSPGSPGSPGSNDGEEPEVKAHICFLTFLLFLLLPRFFLSPCSCACFFCRYKKAGIE